MPNVVFKRYKNALFVTGDTFPIKEVLKLEVKGLWRPNVGPGGWMFPLRKKAVVAKALTKKGCIIEDADVLTGSCTTEPSFPEVVPDLIAKTQKTNQNRLIKKPARFSRPATLVDGMHQEFQAGKEDMDVIRGLLPKIVSQLSPPRTNKGQEGKKMTDKARGELRRADQRRLREMLMSCLRKVWVTWQTEKLAADSELLQDSSDRILKLLTSFETGGACVSTARAGGTWQQIKNMIEEIASSLREDVETKPAVPHEGRGTLGVVTLALRELGGAATTSEIKEWIEKNRNKPRVKRLGARLNENSSAARDRPNGTKVWHLTVSACMSNSEHFELTGEKRNGASVWRLSMMAEVDDSKADRGKRRCLRKDVEDGFRE